MQILTRSLIKKCFPNLNKLPREDSNAEKGNALLSAQEIFLKLLFQL